MIVAHTNCGAQHHERQREMVANGSASTSARERIEFARLFGIDRPSAGQLPASTSKPVRKTCCGGRLTRPTPPALRVIGFIMIPACRQTFGGC